MSFTELPASNRNAKLSIVASAEQKAREAFERYKRGYFNDNTDDMIDGWEDTKRYWGESRALEEFWAWQATLPRNEQSDCNPDGGIE